MGYPNPYIAGEPAGTIHSQGKRITLLASELVAPVHATGSVIQIGDPVIHSLFNIHGVAVSEAVLATDYVTIETECVVSLSVFPCTAAGVSAAVAKGDALYIRSDVTAGVKISPDPTGGYVMGIALSALTGSATASVIQVLVKPYTLVAAQGAVTLPLSAAVETLDADGAAALVGTTIIDSTSVKVDLTLADGSAAGQMKLFICSVATNTGTLSVAKHFTSDPETFLFDSVDDYLLLVWSGTQWITVAGTATAT